jgi:hypothetical protein
VVLVLVLSLDLADSDIPSGSFGLPSRTRSGYRDPDNLPLAMHRSYEWKNMFWIDWISRLPIEVPKKGYS